VEEVARSARRGMDRFRGCSGPVLGDVGASAISVLTALLGGVSLRPQVAATDYGIAENRVSGGRLEAFHIEYVDRQSRAGHLGPPQGQMTGT
jgi:hypothetical protein